MRFPNRPLFLPVSETFCLVTAFTYLTISGPARFAAKAALRLQKKPMLMQLPALRVLLGTVDGVNVNAVTASQYWIVMSKTVVKQLCFNRFLALRSFIPKAAHAELTTLYMHISQWHPLFVSSINYPLPVSPLFNPSGA